MVRAQKARRILLVEDDPELMSILRDLLSRTGYAVTTATSGADALRMVSPDGVKPDLVLSDVRMGPVDGMTLLKRLRADNPALPIILMSAFANGDLEEEALRSGATDFFKKPFSLVKMAQAIQDQLAKKAKNPSK